MAAAVEAEMKKSNFYMNQNSNSGSSGSGSSGSSSSGSSSSGSGSSGSGSSGSGSSNRNDSRLFGWRNGNFYGGYNYGKDVSNNDTRNNFGSYDNPYPPGYFKENEKIPPGVWNYQNGFLNNNSGKPNTNNSNNSNNRNNNGYNGYNNGDSNYGYNNNAYNNGSNNGSNNKKSFFGSFGNLMTNFTNARTSSSYPPSLPQTCVNTMYGCCPDGMTAKMADGTNCFANQQAMAQTNSNFPVQPNEMYSGVTPFNTSTVLIPPPIGNVTTSSCNNNCPVPPPCPACERCPEPSFDCKKVPKYESPTTQKVLPQAILTDFSSFGM